MKTDEDKKIIRVFAMIAVWTLFVSITAAGLLYAGDNTRYIDEKKETETVKISFDEMEKYINEKLEVVF